MSRSLASLLVKLTIGSLSPRVADSNVAGSKVVWGRFAQVTNVGASRRLDGDLRLEDMLTLFRDRIRTWMEH